jgi:hypothetical protein
LCVGAALPDEFAFPTHGRLNCSRCFKNGESIQQIGRWQMKRDPGAWGSARPKYLVLGCSKGATQVNIYANGDFDSVAFGGECTRRNLTNILRKVGLLMPHETVDEKIRAGEKEFHFASLVRCSLSRYDSKNSAYRTSGPLIIKAFSEVSSVIDNCADAFLTNLPDTLRVILVLGVDNTYIKKFRDKMRGLHPIGFRDINEVAYENERMLWVHLTHPSKGNGTLKAWLTGGANETSGRKRELAFQILRDRGLCRA